MLQWVISQHHAELAHISCPVINVEEMLAGKTRPVRAVKRTNSRNFPHPGKKGSESVIFHAAAHIIHFSVDIYISFESSQP